MQEALRNVVTGEVIEIDNGSPDYREKRKETYDHAGTIKPLWEITSQAHADRIDEEGPTEFDMGYQNKPLVAAPAIKADDLVFGRRREQLTPAEVEHGIENIEQKEKERQAMFGELGGDAVTQTIDVVDPGKREERGKQQAGRQTKQAKRSGSSGDSGSSSGASGSSSSSGASTGTAKSTGA